MKYQIITFGCQMNKSDSERIASLLEGLGYQPTSKENKADLIVINMCSVRQSAVDRVYGKLNQISKIKNQNNKSKFKVILTGCILSEDKKKLKDKVDFILNIKDLPNWPKLLSPTFYDRRKCGIKEDGDYFKIRPKYQNNFLAYIPISTGCNNACSYCVVPFTRGPLICRHHKEILKEVKNLVQRGFKEIWLLGQNVNEYKSPIISKLKTNKGIKKFTLHSLPISSLLAKNNEVNFPQLIKMVDKIPGDFKFFFTSPHPRNFSDELIDTLSKCEKFGRYLNLPVQSGDDEILKKMNRNYTVKEYKNLVKKIREKIPGIRLSTDAIVGFPGETEKQFQNTVKLFKEIKFDMAYIAKYSPRKRTPASRLKDNVPLVEKKQREKILKSFLKK
jgi:tRNA-2-methylthio-N6-dimethylallyladenosine synthase